MSEVTVSGWIGIGQSLILVITIILVVLQYRQSSKQHHEDVNNIIRSFSSQIHERLLSNLLELNRIMLEFPDDIKKIFKDTQNSTAESIRGYCYVYAVIDIVHYLILHREFVDPFVEEHLKNLASLLYTEPRINEIFNSVKAQQSESLLSYLESQVKPKIVGVEKK